MTYKSISALKQNKAHLPSFISQKIQASSIQCINTNNIKRVNNPDIRVSNKTIIKNGWLIEQRANYITFNSRLCSDTFVDSIIHADRTETRKNKARSIKERRIERIGNDLYNPLIYSKTLYKESYIDRNTGEVFEFKLAVYKNLFAKGHQTITEYLTPFKKLDFKSYTKVREVIERI